MKGKISAKGIRVKVLQKLIELHNTLYERYEAYDWKGSNIYPDFKNYLWSMVKEEGCDGYPGLLTKDRT